MHETDAAVTAEEIRNVIGAFIQTRLQAKLDKLKAHQHVERERAMAAHEPQTGWQLQHDECCGSSRFHLRYSTLTPRPAGQICLAWETATLQSSMWRPMFSLAVWRVMWQAVRQQGR